VVLFRRVAGQAAGGVKRSSEHVRGSSSSVGRESSNKKRRVHCRSVWIDRLLADLILKVGGNEIVSLPVVMSTNVVNARKAYFDKFRYEDVPQFSSKFISIAPLCRNLIGFELDDDMKDVEDRLLKWSEARLRHEGCALFRLVGKLTVC